MGVVIHILGKEGSIKKTCQIFHEKWMTQSIITTQFPFAASCTTGSRCVSGIDHELHSFTYVILTSCIEDHENLALVEKDIPLKFWPVSAE